MVLIGTFSIHKARDRVARMSRNARAQGRFVSDRVNYCYFGGYFVTIRIEAVGLTRLCLYIEIYVCIGIIKKGEFHDE